MKRIIKSNFKFSLSRNINKKIINFPVKQIRSSAGIRGPPVGKKDKIDIEDVVGKRVGKVGIVELNREYKCNVLTENFMTDIRRSLEAMEIDEDMRVVVMRSKYFNAFCMGTDLKYLYYNKINGEYHKIDQYLEKLYNFNHFISVYHKPLLGLCTGQAKGSGVSFLSSCSFPMSTETTEASFPETGFGYIPDGGSMFFLSRLEGELGTFLALTGFPIVNWDLVKLGLTRDYTYPDLEEPLAVSTMGRNIFGSLHEYTEKWEETFKNRQIEKNSHNFNNMHSHLSRDELKKMNLLSNGDPFTYPWERKYVDNSLNPSPTVFHSMIEKDIHSDKEVNFKHSKGRYFNDTYENFINLVYSRIPIIDQRYFSLAHIVKDINRLFRFNTVKEIYEALKEENSYFSEMCLAFLDKKSPLSLEVTLRMLRNARKMNYTEIIKQEINVARNLIMKNKDFDTVMQSRISKSKENVKFAKSLSQVTQEDIDEIFEDSKILSKIKLDVKDNSLLPHNRYFDKHPDCFRLWINENPRAHGDIRENFDYEVKHYMIENFGIDLRDSNITIDEVRKILTKIETNHHTREKNNAKFSNLLSDSKFMNEYFNKRQEVISKFENDKDGLKDLVSTKMKKLYQDNLIGLSKKLYGRCRDIREIEKRRTYLRLKRWLFMNRIMEYKTRRTIISNERIRAVGNKAFFIPKDDNVSFRDTVNPELKNSPFYQLVGLFTIKTISPEYALRFSTTDPNKEIFSYLEINQEKLKEIKEQLKQNPKKFLEVWDSVYDKQAEAEFNEVEEKSLVEYEKVYRMRHEGHSTLDKLPYYKEYQELKTKWHDIKKHTTEILKKMTHDLVIEIIEKENFFNKNLIEAGKDKNIDMEKFEEIKALYNIVNDNKSEIDEFYETASNVSNLVEDRVNILKQNINSAINNDPFYQKLNEMINNSEKSQNIEMKEFMTNFNDKVIELTQNLVTKSLLDGVEKNSQFNSKDVESTLVKLFNIQNKDSSSSFNSDFINWLYLKYGTQNIFSDILKKSKFSIISLLKNQLENELFNHSNNILSKIKDNKIDIIRAIYNKEKSLLEDVLKDYFETKLNLLNLDLLEKKELISNGVSSSITMEYVFDTLKEISFCHVLLTNSEKVPRSISSILSSLDSATQEKTLIELYVNVQETISQNESNDEITKNLKNLFKYLTKEMKNSEWFMKLTNYTTLSATDGSVNIDQKIEDFMKKRFNEIIYSDSIQDVDYYIDMRKVGEMLKEKLDLFNLNQLVKDYRSDKISLNEENITAGIFSDPVKLNEKKEFYSLKLKLSEKLKKIENQFNIGNLKKKYSDYLFNSDFYIHKILCNVKNPEEIFSGKIEDSQKFGKFLFELKRNLDETYFDLSNENNKTANVAAKSFNYLTRLKTILFNHKEYVANLENLNQFIKNKTKFNEKIEGEFLDKLDFVSKYEVKILLNDIQADSEKLYNHLNSVDENGKITIDRKEFLIPSENFYTQFGKINLDELIGFEGSNLEYLKELNNRIKEIVKSQLSALNTEVVQKRGETMKELSVSKENTITDLKDSKLKDFSSKVQSTIKGLKNIQAIKRKDKLFNNSTDLKDYLKNIENPGLNFSRVMETLLGRKLSLQELITNDGEKTLYDYLQDNNFDKVFSKKIPSDLVKCAIQVLDARLLKALKLILSSELQTEYSLNDFIHYIGNNNYLQLQPDFFTDEELTFFSELLGDLEDYKVDYMDGKEIIDPEELETFQKQTEDMNKKVEEAEKFVNDYKKIVIVDSNGHKVLIRYKKGSIFNNILNLHRLDTNKKREVGDKIIRKLQEIVPLPDLSSQYTLLKYVYDYHMGNLQTFYETHRKEAESRIYSLNNVMFLENLERMEKYDQLLAKLYPEKNIFNPNTIDNDEDPVKEFDPSKLEVNMEKNIRPNKGDYELIPTYNKETEHLYKYKTEEQKKLIEKGRNLAYKIFVTKLPSDWYMSMQEENHPLIKEILKVELDYYFKVFHNMHLAMKGEKENAFHDRKAASMLLTEEFRAKQEKVRNDNETLRKNEFNLNNPEAIGFGHLIENNNNGHSKETEYYKVLDEMFGEYLKNRKEKLAYTKEKIREQKEKFAQMDNIRVLNPYELLTNSQDAYIDMKSGKINDEKFKMSIQSFLKWNNLNKEYAVFDATDLTDIVDLDNSTSRALYGKYASIPSDLVDLANDDPDAQFLEGEHVLDKNEEKWFEEQIEEILSDFLSHRSQVEKYLTKDQLKALDEDLVKNFTHENFINRVKQNLNREVLSFNFLNDVYEHIRNSENDQERQRMKMKNEQYKFNKNLKDENAFYQNIAYQLRNDKEYNDKIEEDIRKKKKLGRSLKPDKNIEHPLANDLGWKRLYNVDLIYAQLFDKSRVDDKENFLNRMKSNEVNSLDRSVTYSGVTPNQKFNHMKTIVNHVDSNSERINGMYRRKANDILTIMREKSERLDKLDKFNDYLNSNKIGKMH